MSTQTKNTSAVKPNIPSIPNIKWIFGSVNRVLAFGFGSGLAPFAPGTAGTLWAWVLFLVAQYFLTTTQLLWLIGVGGILGCWICGQVSEELGKKDFGGIVWDEMIAFWLILICIMPTNIWVQLLAFALFRFFDAVKPGPIGWIDAYFKKLDQIDSLYLKQDSSPSTSSTKQILWRGFGIIVDDFAAAVFTMLALILAHTGLIALS